MKLMKKLMIISLFVGIAMLIFTIKNTVFASMTPEFYLQKNINEPVDAGTKVEVIVYLKNDGLDTLHGTLMYDKKLVLSSMNILENSDDDKKFDLFEYRPELKKEKEILSKSDNKKVLSFAATANSDWTGNLPIMKLVFDTSNCDENTSYNITWNNEKISGFGPKTYVTLNSAIQSVNTKNTTIQIKGNGNGQENPPEEDPTKGDNDPGNNDGPGIGDNEEKPDPNNNNSKENNKENKTPNGNKTEQNSSKDDNNKTNNNNNNKTNNQKNTNSNVVKENSTKNNQSTTTVADNNVEKMPQTGSNLLTYTIVLLAIIEVCVFISYKKMKKYSGI